MSIGDVKTITLGKIFSMELSQYGEDVDEIVVCADSASFLAVSELQLHRGAVFMIIRGSTFRDGVGAAQARSTSSRSRRRFIASRSAGLLPNWTCESTKKMAPCGATC